MSIAMICTGTELLKGSATNTNLAFLGRELAANAMPPVREITVGDTPSELCAALGDALKYADILIISGGLGPTTDDLTLETTARFFGLSLVENPELKEKVARFWSFHHPDTRCPKNQYKQALVPAEGSYLPNPVGSASGLRFSTAYGGRMRHVFLLPGPPNEFEAMVTASLIPALQQLSGKENTFTHGFLACTGESNIYPLVEKTLAGFPVEVACAAGAGGTRMFISGTDDGMTVAAAEIARRSAGDITCLPLDKFDLALWLKEILLQAGGTISCAESCTGGLLANRFVSMPGASQIFKGGIVAYDNAVKTSLLQVPQEILDTHGAVSAECAAAMAENCARIMNTTCAISTTGIAGPDGGTPEKPVGLVYVGCYWGRRTAVKELRLRGGRRAIRDRAVEMALLQLYQSFLSDGR